MPRKSIFACLTSISRTSIYLLPQDVMTEKWVGAIAYVPAFIKKVRENSTYRQMLNNVQAEELFDEEEDVNYRKQPLQLTREIVTRWGSRLAALLRFNDLRQAVTEVALVMEKDGKVRCPQNSDMDFYEDVQHDE